jgi:serine/threonine protein kinase
VTEREIFLALLDLPDPTARAAYLDRACAGDDELRARVEALLRSHDSAGSFLGSPAVAPADPHIDETQGWGRTEPTDGRASPEEEALTFLSPPERPGSLGRIGHYEVLEVLGRGGFGIVFRAHDEVLQRVVAVKVLAPRMAATSPARKRFLREARSSAQVRHENVVQVYAVEDRPLPYLVMEPIPGETLQQRLDRTGPLEALEAAEIGRQIAEGLAAAHATGLVHRDIKPGNILLEAGPPLRVKITDFGLARAADDASLTQSGVVAGTPMFMSPEQARGERIDERADLFSLGSVLYTMCSGRPPFRANGTLAVLKRVAEDPPRPIPEIIPEVPPWLCALINRLHAKRPEDRFASAREVADLLAHGLAHPQSSDTVPLVPGPARPTELAAVPTPPRRGRWLLGALLLAGLGLGVSEVTGVSDVRGTLLRLFYPGSPLVPAGGTDSGGARPLSADAARWERSVADLPAEEQVQAVAARLKQLNPGFDGAVTPTFADGVVTGLQFSSMEVTDLSPVRALRGLKSLNCRGVEGDGKLADLAPLRGMQLTTLICNNTRVADLSPLRGMRLKELAVHHTRVADLTPLADMPLEHLNCSHTSVADLSTLKGRRLVTLYLDGTPVADLSPLTGMPLKILNCRGYRLQAKRDGDVLRSLDQLESINGEPAADFLKALDAEKDADNN